MAAAMSAQHFSYNKNELLQDLVPDWLTEEHLTGTSIMAIEFDGGVIIGADSRTSSGRYVANRVSDKLTKVTDHVYCCRSGSAADTQAITDIVAYHLAFHEVELDELALVKTSANIFKEMCYNYRDSLSAGIICAGWDKRNGGQVYSIPLGGMIMRQPVSLGGSGSTFIYGYVDSQYKPGMSKEEAIQFVSKALSLAISRDCSSGGVIRLGIITKDGIERKTLFGDDIPKFHEI